MDSLTDADIEELSALCSGGLVRNADLSSISRWRIGGLADLILRPCSSEEVSSLVQWFKRRSIKPVVIGLTTNLLFDDAGLRTPCIQIAHQMGKIDIVGHQVKAQAGVWVPGLARRMMRNGLSGAEHICGIPGTLGGLICMNGGSQRKGIGDNTILVESVDESGRLRTRPAEECDFRYRHSIFQSNCEIVTGATLSYTNRDPASIRAEMRAILSDRRQKFPRKQPNCGSVFKSNPEMYTEIGPPGAAIEKLGFKGRRIGKAIVSPKHANFIVNEGGAKAADVLGLIRAIRTGVEAKTGYVMDVEVYFVSPTGEMHPAG